MNTTSTIQEQLASAEAVEWVQDWLRAKKGKSRMVGRQLRYLIGSAYSWLGALGFGSCALRLAPRDAWIGWDDPTRKRFQDRVLDMRRFLIRPSVCCENLASRVLSMAAERVGPDFARRYGFEPWLLALREIVTN